MNKILFDQRNWVLWFMDAIRSLGGEYEPYRDFEDPKYHEGGRRELAAEKWARTRWIR